ncbi:serine aminopeptidase domain-containing protein [Roseateles sp.]|uniref:alpha/beta hydrolase n=1 Tax=Roseateles sp. TaxID=1971397 RepID=UPI0032641BF5
MPGALLIRQLLTAALFALQGMAHAAEPTTLAPACSPQAGASRAVHEHGFVTLGGIPQWLTVRGDDCRNPGEDFSFLKFVGVKGDGMLWQLALNEQRTRLQLPVFLVQGEEDLLTPPAVTQAYFDRIEAPHKKLVTVPRAGHDPNGPLLDAQLKVLKDDVLSLTR